MTEFPPDAIWLEPDFSATGLWHFDEGNGVPLEEDEYPFTLLSDGTKRRLQAWQNWFEAEYDPNDFWRSDRRKRDFENESWQLWRAIRDELSPDVEVGHVLLYNRVYFGDSAEREYAERIANSDLASTTGAARRQAANSTYECRQCGERHPGPPLAFHADAPHYWKRRYRLDPRSALSGEQCVIKGKQLFVRGLIRLPIVGTEEHFEWGVWVSLSEESFARMHEMWHIEGREAEPPYFGWLATELAAYSPSTLNLKTHLHTRAVGNRPTVELEPSDHPLSMEQREGITMDRVQGFAEQLLHRK